LDLSSETDTISHSLHLPDNRIDVYLKQLSLVNFKNVAGAEMNLGAKFNCFVGNNGSGKTTVLDAVHYLSVCKSFLNPNDTQNIRRQEPFLVINGTFEKDDEEVLVYCAVKQEGKKHFKRNRKEYKRLLDHVGHFPSVVIAPTDSDIINGGSELRRKFMDAIISQLDREYLENLLRYNKALQHRNTLLKQFADSHSFSAESLDVWDFQLAQLGQSIHRRRNEFLEAYITEFDRYYRQMSGDAEHAGLVYESQLNGHDMLELLTRGRDRDRAATYTTIGIHKDDLELTISGHSLKRFGSQGQQKTALVALKLAQFHVMRKKCGFAPLLLLDDIFDKLDDSRVGQLLKMVGEEGFGQILITDTHPERVASLLKDETDVRVFRVSGGEVVAS